MKPLSHFFPPQSIKESLQLPAEYEVKMNMETGREEVVYDEDLDEDKNSVFSRLPHDMTGFLENITTAQGCLLLLVLREHLKVYITSQQVFSASANMVFFCVSHASFL